MYMAMADDRVAIQREPVRAVGMGFAPAGVLVASSAGGPAGIVVGAVIAAIPLLVGWIKGLFRKGHEDDDLGNADGQMMGQVVAPILSEFLGGISVAGTWMDVDPKTDMLARDISLFENGKGTSVPFYKMPAARASELLNWGDAALQQWCQSIATTKWPCHTYVSGASGAGTLFFTKWNRLRPMIERAVALLAQTENAGFSYAQEMERAASGQPLQAGWEPSQQPTPAAGAAVQSVGTWFSGKTVIGGQPVPNAMLAIGAGLALAWAVSK